MVITTSGRRPPSRSHVAPPSAARLIASKFRRSTSGRQVRPPSWVRMIPLRWPKKAVPGWSELNAGAWKSAVDSVASGRDPASFVGGWPRTTYAPTATPTTTSPISNSTERPVPPGRTRDSCGGPGIGSSRLNRPLRGFTRHSARLLAGPARNDRGQIMRTRGRLSMVEIRPGPLENWLSAAKACGRRVAFLIASIT